jgi:hypothetical protein
MINYRTPQVTPLVKAAGCYSKTNKHRRFSFVICRNLSRFPWLAPVIAL